MEITRKNAGEGLRKHREKYGKTLEFVSDKTGIARTTLYRIENDLIPQAKTVFKLNQYLKDYPDN